MPKPVNPLSVLRPATETATSARVKLMRSRKHTKKLNNEVMDVLVDKALEAVEKLEVYLKKELDREKRLSNASKD